MLNMTVHRGIKLFLLSLVFALFLIFLLEGNSIKLSTIPAKLSYVQWMGGVIKERMANNITSVMAKFRDQTNLAKQNYSTSALKSPNTTSDLLVPNIFHFTWFFNKHRRFKFLHAVSVLSTFRKHGPKEVNFWYENLPGGQWWIYLMKVIINNSYPFKLKYMMPPDAIFGRKIKFRVHVSDIVRINLLNKYGGMYLDLDAIVLRPLYPLMKYEFTMGQTTDHALSNGIMFSAPHARFFKLWLDNYKKNYNAHEWGVNSVLAAMKLWKQNPTLVHVENRTLTHPSWAPKELNYMWEEGLFWDWEENYTMHIWDRGHPTDDFNPENIKTMNTTAGQVFRWIWYNTTELIY